MKIYTAGPLGFSEVGSAFHYRELVPMLTELGHEILDPWKLTDQTKIDSILAMPYGPERRARWQQINQTIGENNQKAIDACDVILAVLDGVDVDSGTAAEIGYGFARGKMILGYRGDFRLSADNEGAAVNLQVEHFIRKSGGDIVLRATEIPAALARMTRERQET